MATVFKCHPCICCRNVRVQAISEKRLQEIKLKVKNWNCGAVSQTAVARASGMAAATSAAVGSNSSTDFIDIYADLSQNEEVSLGFVLFFPSSIDTKYTSDDVTAQVCGHLFYMEFKCTFHSYLQREVLFRVSFSFFFLNLVQKVENKHPQQRFPNVTLRTQTEEHVKIKQFVVAKSSIHSLR